MRIAWATDTHLNFVSDEHVAAFGAKLAQYEGAVITGDVSDLHNLAKHVEILKKSGARIWLVAGNHDAYGGSIAVMRQILRRVTDEGPVKYLHDMDVVRLTEKTALVGADGWYDGRNGNYMRSRVELNDFYCISEMVGSKTERLAAMQKYADESAALIETWLEQAMAIPELEQVLVATHVPPFAGASWHEGKPSDDQYNPFFSNKSVGEAIVRASKKGKAKVTVLCGHSHSPGTIHVEGVTCHTGGARYGDPEIFRVLDVP